MRPNFWTLGAGAIVASLFLFEAHRSPAVHVVPVPVVPVPLSAEQSPLEKGVHALPKRLTRGIFVPPAVGTEPGQAPAASATGPSSEPSQPAVSVVPCNSLSCAKRHESLEPSAPVLTRSHRVPQPRRTYWVSVPASCVPYVREAQGSRTRTSLGRAARTAYRVVHHRSWADLTFQPSLDWKGGGVRGDCVAGELEYIMPKYCDPVPRDGTAATLRKGEAPFPSEQRLAEIDVRAPLQPYVRRLQPYVIGCRMHTLHVHAHVHAHAHAHVHCMRTRCTRPYPTPTPNPNPNPNQVHTAGLPKALMADLVRTVGNRTLLFMGDSVMEQVRARVRVRLRTNPHPNHTNPNLNPKPNPNPNP